MTKFFLTILVGTFLSTAYAGIEVRNGGGGVYKGGQYMTFQTAGIPVHMRELAISDLQPLELVIRVVQNSMLRTETKANLSRHILPSVARHYYKADTDRLDPKVKSDITAEYKKNMNVVAEDFVLYAVTDAKTQTTILMPEFFQLRPTEQAAMLLHESLWTYQEMQSYEQVVDAEMAFQDFSETQSPNVQQIWKLYRSLLTALNDYQQLTGIAYTLSADDIATTPVQSIVGASGYQCLVFNMYGNQDWDKCTPDIINNLALLRVSGHFNYFYEVLYNYLMNPNTALMLKSEKHTNGQLVRIAQDGAPLYFNGPIVYQDRSTALPMKTAAGQQAGYILLK